MEGIKRMRYTPQEKINSLLSKIATHTIEIKVIMDKMFNSDKKPESKPYLKNKLKKSKK